jgi:hypothetical protein
MALGLPARILERKPRQAVQPAEDAADR